MSWQSVKETKWPVFRVVHITANRNTIPKLLWRLMGANTLTISGHSRITLLSFSVIQNADYNNYVNTFILGAALQVRLVEEHSYYLLRRKY